MAASPKARRMLPLFTEWLSTAASVFDARTVGVTVARKVSTSRMDYHNVVTVEVFGSHNDDDVLDSDCPEPSTGDESVTLTPEGARELAALLVKAADKADAARARARQPLKPKP